MQNLPLFPAFRKFSIDDQSWYNEFYKQFDPYADFSFGNLLVWLDQFDDLSISAYEGNVIFSATVLFMESEKIITLLGRNHLKQTIAAIFDLQKSTGQIPVVSGLTEVVAHSSELLDSGYSIVPDRENFEYLYPSQAWATLESSAMRKLRREVSTYQKEYGDQSEVRPLNLQKQEHIELIRQGLVRWSNVFSHNDADHSEAQVLERLFELADHLSYQAIGLFVNDTLEAFLIYQRLPQETTVLFSHVKASYNYRYMFDYLLHASAQIVVESGVIQINFEQDLGIAGLRTHKESLKPTGFFEKFTIRQAVS